MSFPATRKALAQQGGALDVNGRVVIQPDDTVVIRIARIEMGQGSLSGLAQLLAEELECDWDKNALSLECFVYGLSAMLYGECAVKDGRIEQQNFDTDNVMRLDEMPHVEVITVPSGGFWGGVGEPTIAVAAPAVLNAVFAATSKRVRNMPLKNIDLGSA